MVSSSVFRCWAVVIAVLFPCVVIVYAVYLSTKPQSDQPSTLGARAVPSLEFVVVVSRHGNRRPLYPFPNEPYPDKFWNCELGELTKMGKLEMYNLGVKFRSLYNGFLNVTYSSRDIRATSTPLSRTLMSGEAFLAGLYPPSGDQVWNEDIPWQPIPVYTDSPDDSQISQCPKYENEIMKALEEVYKENLNVIRNVSDYLDKYSGGNSSQPHYLYEVWDSLSSDKIASPALPEWTKPVFPEPLSNIVGQQSIARAAGSDAITRIISSALIIQIVSLMEGKINGSLTPDYQMYYYSAHDTTIMALQAAIGIPKPSINSQIYPGSAMIFELHRSPDNSHRVEVLYMDGQSLDSQPTPVDVPGCQRNCTFSQLLDITAKFRNFTSEHDECYNT